MPKFFQHPILAAVLASLLLLRGQSLAAAPESIEAELRQHLDASPVVLAILEIASSADLSIVQTEISKEDGGAYCDEVFRFKTAKGEEVVISSTRDVLYRYISDKFGCSDSVQVEKEFIEAKIKKIVELMQLTDFVDPFEKLDFYASLNTWNSVCIYKVNKYKLMGGGFGIVLSGCDGSLKLFSYYPIVLPASWEVKISKSRAEEIALEYAKKSPRYPENLSVSNSNLYLIQKTNYPEIIGDENTDITELKLLCESEVGWSVIFKSGGNDRDVYQIEIGATTGELLGGLP